MHIYFPETREDFLALKGKPSVYFDVLSPSESPQYSGITCRDCGGDAEILFVSYLSKFDSEDDDRVIRLNRVLTWCESCRKGLSVFRVSPVWSVVQEGDRSALRSSWDIRGVDLVEVGDGRDFIPFMISQLRERNAER